MPSEHSQFNDWLDHWWETNQGSFPEYTREMIELHRSVDKHYVIEAAVEGRYIEIGSIHVNRLVNEAADIPKGAFRPEQLADGDYFTGHWTWYSNPITGFFGSIPLIAIVEAGHIRAYRLPPQQGGHTIHFSPMQSITVTELMSKEKDANDE